MSLLTGFVRDATPEQIEAWRASVAPLQQQCGVVLDARLTRFLRDTALAGFTPSAVSEPSAGGEY